MPAALVDFHCHLDLYPDPVVAIAECDRKRIYTLTVTTTPKAWPRNRELASSSRYVRSALGLHPQLVSERASELSIWDDYLPQAKYVGEVGLDAGPRFYRSLDLQKQVFEHILKCCARAGGKILTVHSVRAASAVLDLIEKHLPAARGRVVLHWFTGSKTDARRGVDLGCYFSVNASMLERSTGSELVRTLPLDRILTETDGPFTHVAGRPTRPDDVDLVVKELARIRMASVSAMGEAIQTNLRELVSLVDSREL
ncbi:MAG: Qat anti-phage system TatD family nuclease QatD [Candidatus Binatia bacterium]